MDKISPVVGCGVMRNGSQGLQYSYRRSLYVNLLDGRFIVIIKTSGLAFENFNQVGNHIVIGRSALVGDS